MKIAAMVLGIIGGLVGLGGALFAMLKVGLRNAFKIIAKGMILWA